MAYSFGGGINPQLGAIDYSPILRGAQNYAQSTAAGSAAIGQGIGSALASLGGAVQQYYDKKEKKELDEKAFTVAKNILRDNPEAQRLFGIKDMSDDKLIKSVVKTAGAPAILSIASQFDRAQRESKAIQAAMAAGPSQAQQMIQGGARFEDLGGASFAPAPVGASEFLSRYAGAGGSNLGAAVNAAQLVGGRQGNPLEEAKTMAEIQNLNARTAQLGQPAPIGQAEQERLNIARETLQLQKEAAIAKGQEKAAASFASQEKAIARASKLKANLANTVKNIDEAIAIAATGGGGPIEGIPLVAGAKAVMGSSKHKRLINLIDSVKASLSINTIMEMKDLSQNGATGFGQFSDREGAKTESNISVLDPTLNERDLIANLKQIRDFMTTTAGLGSDIFSQADAILAQPK